MRIDVLLPLAMSAILMAGTIGGSALAAGQTRIAVETDGPKGVQTVTIDAQSGQVVGTHAGGEPD